MRKKLGIVETVIEDEEGSSVAEISDEEDIYEDSVSEDDESGDEASEVSEEEPLAEGGGGA